MKAKRTGAALSLLAAGALMLSACGSDNNTGASGGGTGGSATGDIACGGKKSLKASGSSAQANAMTRFVTAYETACPGFTLNYTSSGSGAGVSEFIGGANRFRWLRLAAERREGRGRQGQGALRRQRRLEPACRVRSDRRHLQRGGGRRARARRADAGQDLQRRRDDLERPGDRGAQRGQGAARRADQRPVPQRRVGHHRQLPEVPRCRFRRRVGQGRRQVVRRRRRRGRQGQRGHVGGDQEHARFDHLQRVVLREEPGPAGREDHHLRRPGAGRADHRVGRNVDRRVKVKGEGNDLVLDTSSFYMPTEPGSYPIMLATYEIVCSKYPEADVATAVKAFLHRRARRRARTGWRTTDTSRSRRRSRSG